LRHQCQLVGRGQGTAALLVSSQHGDVQAHVVAVPEHLMTCTDLQHIQL
jgi:hypothetical protein